MKYLFVFFLLFFCGCRKAEMKPSVSAEASRHSQPYPFQPDRGASNSSVPIQANDSIPDNKETIQQYMESLGHIDQERSKALIEWERVVLDSMRGRGGISRMISRAQGERQNLLIRQSFDAATKRLDELKIRLKTLPVPSLARKTQINYQILLSEEQRGLKENKVQYVRLHRADFYADDKKAPFSLTPLESRNMEKQEKMQEHRHILALDHAFQSLFELQYISGVFSTWTIWVPDWVIASLLSKASKDINDGKLSK